MTENTSAPDADEMAEIDASIALAIQTCFRLSHHYDIGDQSIYIERKTGAVDAKRAAVYCVFMSEEWYGRERLISNLGIAACLCAFYGFRHAAVTPLSTRIDLYYDKERMCGPGYVEMMKDKSLNRDGLREFMAPFID